VAAVVKRTRFSLTARRHAQGREEMSFASARVTDEHDRLCALQIAALHEFAELRW
jgi:hypothetical protein